MSVMSSRQALFDDRACLTLTVTVVGSLTHTEIMKFIASVEISESVLSMLLAR